MSMKTTKSTLTKTVLGGSSVLLALTLGATQASAISLSDIPVIGGAFNNTNQVSTARMNMTSETSVNTKGDARVWNDTSAQSSAGNGTNHQSGSQGAANVDTSVNATVNSTAEGSTDGNGIYGEMLSDTHTDADLNFGSLLEDDADNNSSENRGWIRAHVSAWIESVINLFTRNDSDIASR